MPKSDDTISQLASVTAEMAEIQDLGGRRMSYLLEVRALLIRNLIQGGFDPRDSGLTSIIANADRLQEKLQRRADSIRRELSGARTMGALVSAVQSTLIQPETNSLDIRG